ncbi:MAG TPA: DUF1501 domain-containing protein [Planctomycetaceae bacterium]|nr:DUF1501 domain-containing protein [Planctomycetaceae bacterium]
MLALADLLRGEGKLLEGAGGHHPAAAKRVLLLFMSAGVSHIDTFDHKPALAKYHGQALEGKGNITDVFFRTPGKLMKSPFAFQQYGQTGKWVSEIFPHQAAHVDELTFIHSMVAEQNSHGPAMYHMSTGFSRNGYPSMGSWVVYGLGNESRDLPAFVTMMDRGMPPSAAANWGNAFLPAKYQGTVFRGEGNPILDLRPPGSYSPEKQKASFEFLARLNDEHARANPGDTELAARIEAYELAARMQLSAPEVADLSRETAATRALYGVDRPDRQQATFSRICLLGRRLLERGVRFVTIYCGGSNNIPDINWDGHANLEKNHRLNALISDQPVAALLTDLKQRGLLEDTLVVWTGEFGRTPTSEGADGRDHNISGFTLWMAGAGLKPGFAYGATDEIGFRAEENPVPICDWHATLLHLLGLDHERLTFYHNGLAQRLTGVKGRVVRDLLAEPAASA